MKPNLDWTDRTVRLLSSVVIAALCFASIINGTVTIVLLMVAGIFIITSQFGFCRVYCILKIKTNKK